MKAASSDEASKRKRESPLHPSLLICKCEAKRALFAFRHPSSFHLSPVSLWLDDGAPKSRLEPLSFALVAAPRRRLTPLMLMTDFFLSSASR